MKVIIILCFVCVSLPAFTQAVNQPKQSPLDSVSRAARTELNKKAAQYSSQEANRLEEEKKKRSDSLLVVLQRDLQVSKEVADSLIGIINGSIKAMDGIAYDRTIPPPDKINRFKALAAERDNRIAALLTAAQRQQLHTIMTRGRQKPTR
ncbi:MAG TPA: hypothetical protein VGE66_20115 [Chitinophagaceae bacterium]